MKDLSDLPRDRGVLPDPEPRLAPLLAEAWAKTVDTSEKAFADSDARVRHSWAGMCARRIAYEMTDTEVTEPLTIADYWRFGIGTLIHEEWQKVIPEAFPTAEIEKKVTIPEIPSAGHIDLFIPGDDNQVATAVELKSINGFGFKQSIGARGAAEGPRSSAILQGALNAKASDAEELVLVSLSLENLSPRELVKIGTEQWQRFAAEWTYTKDQWSPMAEKETRRMQRIVGYVDEQKLPPRALPDLPSGARISAPDIGAWEVRDSDGDIVDAGKTWHCGYCPFQSQCIEDGA